MSKTIKGSLSGVGLMHVIKMSVPVPCRIEYTVRHRGKGKNELRVRFGSFFHLLWGNVHDFELESGKSKSRMTEEKSDDTGSEDQRQDVRWRLSRKVLTKEIDWELTYTITRLKDDRDVTDQCEPSVTHAA